MNIRRVIEIRYAQIRSLDLSNGEGVGVALFVQGCPFDPHCKGCFNRETWDFDGGKEWTSDIQNKFIKLASRSYIKRISILGGEPLADKNLEGVLDLVNEIRLSMPHKSIWLYTGYEWEHIFDTRWHYHPQTQENLSIDQWRRQQIVSQCDVLIDGQYINTQKDFSLKWRGSQNQRIISVKKSLNHNKIILFQN